MCRKKRTSPVTYTPSPVDTSDVVLSEGINELIEKLAANTHDVWAAGRIKDGWSYGEKRNDRKKLHPDLVPYGDLTEAEKQYDRDTAAETLCLITKLGYAIVPAEATASSEAPEADSDVSESADADAQK